MIRLTLILILTTATLFASQTREQEAAVQQIKSSLGTFQKEIRNHESELTTLSHRLNNQETTLELLREQLQEKKGDPGVGQVESRVTSLVGDIQKIRTHANELSEAINKTQSRLGQLESTIEAQGRNITNMQAALKSMLEAFDMKETVSTDGKYKVQNGDSLEKIARKNNTTISKLKELNNLKNDRIWVGQSLKLP